MGTPVGRVTVEDLDMGENTDVSFLIKEGGDLFKVSADVESQRAVVSIKKVQLTEFCVALQHLVMVLIFTLVKKSRIYPDPPLFFFLLCAQEFCGFPFLFAVFIFVLFFSFLQSVCSIIYC